jgi:PAS domain S-box-containing protein
VTDLPPSATALLVDVPSADSRLPDVIDQLSDGYYEMDSAFRYRRVNAAGARLVRRAPEELIGRHVLDLFPEVEHAEVHQAVQRVMSGGPPERVETYFAPLGIWGINSIYPVRDGVAIVSRDVTAQKLLEQNLTFLAEASKALAASLDFQRTLRNVAKLAVPRVADWCAIDLLTGPATVELLAVAHVDPKKVRWARQLRRRQPIDLSRPTGVPKVLRTGQPEFYPEISDEMLVATARDERTLELLRGLGFSSAMIVPLPVQGRAIGALTFVAAESGRRYTPSDLAMAEELGSRAALAIENSRLYTEARRAVALRDDFISVASHELRTPVTSLKVYVEVLRRRAEAQGDEPIVRSLDRMTAQIDRLAGLIGDMLAVAKIEAGKLALARERVDLRAVADEVIEAIQPTAPGHRIEVDGTVTKLVAGDMDRLAQVLTNLLTNAVKYSPQADRVVVRLADGPHGAVVEVEDFGIGMDKEHLSRVFDRFYRVSSPDEKTFPGLGIGLTIAHEIVQRHGGTMRVKSMKGRGSVFRVTLPYLENNGPVAAQKGTDA